MMASAGTALRNQRAKCQDGSANSSTTHRSLFVAEHQADVVILGGGSGGYAAALRAAELNKSVILVEKDKVGGTCLHRGCIPTKALLHAGEVADLSREAEQFGVQTTFSGIDMKGVNAYKDAVVSRLYRGVQGLFKAHKVAVFEGEGRLVAPNAIEVGGQRITG